MRRLNLVQVVLCTVSRLFASCGRSEGSGSEALIVLSGIGVLFDAWDAGGTVQASRRFRSSCGSCRLASTAPSRGSRHRPASSRPSHELRRRSSVDSAGSQPRAVRRFRRLQSLSWNPSITGGAKSEDTAPVTADGVEVMTWTPALPGSLLRQPQVLTVERPRLRDVEAAVDVLGAADRIPAERRATAVFVAWMNFGEPESPKQLPPFPQRRPRDRARRVRGDPPVAGGGRAQAVPSRRQGRPSSRAHSAGDSETPSSAGCPNGLSAASWSRSAATSCNAKPSIELANSALSSSAIVICASIASESA
jgi:hypothetical protein